MKRMILAAFLAVSAFPALSADTTADRKAVASSTDEARAQAGKSHPGAAKQQCKCHVNR
jgi:hypothetical protein